MTSEKFNEIFEETVQKSRDILCKKAEEYAAEADRLHNFKQAAGLQRESAVKTLGGMMVKHTISLYDLIRDHEEGKKSASRDLWDEKIMDNINYLILLRALLEDR